MACLSASNLGDLELLVTGNVAEVESRCRKKKLMFFFYIYIFSLINSYRDLRNNSIVFLLNAQEYGCHFELLIALFYPMSKSMIIVHSRSGRNGYVYTNRPCHQMGLLIFA